MWSLETIKLRENKLLLDCLEKYEPLKRRTENIRKRLDAKGYGNVNEFERDVASLHEEYVEHQKNIQESALSLYTALSDCGLLNHPKEVYLAFGELLH